MRQTDLHDADQTILAFAGQVGAATAVSSVAGRRALQVQAHLIHARRGSGWACNIVVHAQAVRHVVHAPCGGRGAEDTYVGLAGRARFARFPVLASRLSLPPRAPPPSVTARRACHVRLACAEGHGRKIRPVSGVFDLVQKLGDLRVRSAGVVDLFGLPDSGTSRGRRRRRANRLSNRGALQVRACVAQVHRRARARTLGTWTAAGARGTPSAPPVPVSSSDDVSAASAASSASTSRSLPPLLESPPCGVLRRSSLCERGDGVNGAQRRPSALLHRVRCARAHRDAYVHPPAVPALFLGPRGRLRGRRRRRRRGTRLECADPVRQVVLCPRVATAAQSAAASTVSMGRCSRGAPVLAWEPRPHRRLCRVRPCWHRWPWAGPGGLAATARRRMRGSATCPVRCPMRLPLPPRAAVRSLPVGPPSARRARRA